MSVVSGLIACAGLPGILQAQSGAPPSVPQLQGIVAVEPTYEPVGGASVTLIGLGMQTKTGWLGKFSFAEVPPGRVAIRVSAPGRPTVVQEVAVNGDGVSFVQFLLPPVGAILSELLVEVGSRKAAARDQAQSAADVVAEQVPSLRWRRTDLVRDHSAPILLRGVNSVEQSLEPSIYLDGVLLTSADPLDLLNQIPASEVESVEVLRGPAASFLYSNAANGVILIRTKR